MSLLKAGPKLT